MSTIERQASTLPPLVDGERLSRAEFHERYEAMPPGTRAELIEGVVHIMASPLGPSHGSTHADVMLWLGVYRARTPDVKVFDNASTILDDEAEPQPDAILRIEPVCGGRMWMEGKYLAGGPELIVEVADTSRTIDLGPKRRDYERTGVQEYVVVALDPEEVYWHVRRGDNLVSVPAGADGLYRSEVFPGLWLDPDALLASDASGLLAALEPGLRTPEHEQFVARLAEIRAQNKAKG